MKTITIYTDGSSLGNPGPGGYGIVIMQDGKTKEFSQGFRKTTNNRMELLATIIAIESSPKNVKIEIFSDSSYVVNAINKNWLDKWQKNGWKTANKKRVKNKDLWQRLLRILNQSQIKWNWVKGHAGNKHNERCDELAVLAAKSENLLIDSGYEHETESQSNPQLTLF